MILTKYACTVTLCCVGSFSSRQSLNLSLATFSFGDMHLINRVGISLDIFRLLLYGCSCGMFKMVITISLLAILSHLQVTAVLVMDVSQLVKSTIGAKGSCDDVNQHVNTL